ncbi:MAG TPA: HAMP domain-containing sensor histidine kinase [Solirubrobacteraceae bacterium]|nr:HAMP domain-containing sensor histidine kinase [Solirubrobacteraceae bacterium]
MSEARLPVSVGLGLVKRRRPAGGVPGATSNRPSATFQATGTYGLLLSSSGDVLKMQSFTLGGPAPPAPTLPAHFPITQPRSSALRIFTVDSNAGSGVQYRATALSLGNGQVLVIAVPVTEVQQTLHRLIMVETLVAGGVILGLILLGWLVIRLGLRPLERIGKVASEIARGDLSRRVTPGNPRTEVGRLGASLNEMLVQIEQAFADRRESEERLRRFLADASHELRTPLASIRGYAELFRLGAASDHASLERAMARIESETVRMGGMVDDLLTLARLDELPEVLFVPVDLRALADNAVHDTRAIAPRRRVTLIGDDPVTVLGDPGQLRQVLANLTRNAVIHTEDGTPVDVSVSRQGGHAEIVVRDYGSGLPADADGRVFDRFWRANGGRSRGPGGAGLGLAIVKAVVHAHHGDVQSENAPDGGARFRVTLPLAPGSPSADAAAAEPQSSRRVAVPS